MIPDEEWSKTFQSDSVGIVREYHDDSMDHGRLFEMTADGWRPYRFRAGKLLQLHEDHDSTYRVRELAFHLIKEGANKAMVTDLELIAIAGIVDRGDLKAENQVRCPNCNHYTTVGHVCDYCGADVDRS